MCSKDTVNISHGVSSFLIATRNEGIVRLLQTQVYSPRQHRGLYSVLSILLHFFHHQRLELHQKCKADVPKLLNPNRPTHSDKICTKFHLSRYLIKYFCALFWVLKFLDSMCQAWIKSFEFYSHQEYIRGKLFVYNKVNDSFNNGKLT